MTKEVQKVVTLRGVHAEKCKELQRAFGWSGIRLASFVLAYTQQISTVEKAFKILFPESQPKRVDLAKSIFIPMQEEEAAKINQLVKSSEIDFTTHFKLGLNIVYNDWKAGKLDFKKNKLTERFNTRT